MFAPHFDQRVTVKNRAVGSRSVRTWLYDVQAATDETGECPAVRAAALVGSWTTGRGEQAVADVVAHPNARLVQCHRTVAIIGIIAHFAPS